ncbi:Uncharacterised protein [Mycobacteroides abscessus subsp. abscessus]|nr:Uncharacterised protein [Mycobacteroides abscessus subsp. abscessus]
MRIHHPELRNHGAVRRQARRWYGYALAVYGLDLTSVPIETVDRLVLVAMGLGLNEIARLFRRLGAFVQLSLMPGSPEC